MRRSSTYYPNLSPLSLSLCSHPKYKQVLKEKMPCLACGKDEFASDSRTQATAEISESQA